MLQSISISNYALIDSLDIEFGSGFNIITGETGAGKSIILGALALILGQRADTSVLRDKTKKCIVEGAFKIDHYNLESFFESAELDYSHTAILRREITNSGISRAFINDTPVNVKTLWELGLQLVDIHSQHQNLELAKNQFQLKLVDLVAGNESLLKDYFNTYQEYQKVQRELAEKKELAAQSKADLDYFIFQYKQLDDAKLQPNEQQELETELEKLNHADEIQSVFGRLSYELEESDVNILNILKEQITQLNRTKEFYPEAANFFDRLQSCYLELKDIASSASQIAQIIENNPEKQLQISQRLDMIYSLQQKHRVNSIAKLIEIHGQLNNRIQQVSSFDEDIQSLEKQLLSLEQVLRELSGKLHESRISVAETIEKKVTSLLREVGIVNAEFSLKFKVLENFTSTGTDLVSFLFSANKNSSPEDISKVASGGEMSRLMLALKALVTDAKALPTIIFDEIDAGISGEIAIKVGQIIQGLSKTVQVINITHLPQIAARGEHHYLVYKFDENEKTYTSIRKLNEDERLIELAKMLSGENYSERTVETAREFLSSNQITY